MARLNLTIPDPLYARLERLRDRVNVSKVSAQALEQELDMLEGRPSIADPKIAQLLQRLQGAHGRWYQRGHDDGTAWAVDHATRPDLKVAATELAQGDGLQLSKQKLPGVPRPADRRARVEVWLLRDLGLAERPRPGVLPEGANAEAYGHFRQALEEVDDAAYLEGWRDALVQLWEILAPALR